MSDSRRAAMRAYWESPLGRENLARAGRQSRIRSGPTNLERGLYWILACAGVEFEREVRFGRYVVDAYDRASHTAYEADGAYWHAAEKDARRDAYLASEHGLRVLRFTEKELWECAS